MSNVIVAEERKEKTSKIRRDGYVPGNIYGPGVERNLNVQFEGRVINRFLKNHSTGSKTKVKINDRELLCVVKQVQYGITGNNPIHIDFYASSEDSPVKVTVPFRFIGREKLAGNRLVLNIIEDEAEIQGLLKDLPEVIEIDVSEMQDGSEITMGDVVLPEGIRLLSREDAVVAKVVSAEPGAEAEDEQGVTAEDREPA